MIAKLAGITALAVAFFALFVFGPFYDNLAAQVALFALGFIWNSLRSSISASWTLVRSTLPFLLTLLFFGSVFQIVRLQGRTDWLTDTLIKCIVFPSSLVLMRVSFSYVTYLDILALPISMDLRFDLITIKSAFQKGGPTLRRFSWYLDTYPYLAQGNRAKRLIAKYTSLIVSLYLYLYHETENAYLLLQNRYHHLQEGAE